MSEPVKHHYVPQIYLKRFSLNPNGDLYTLKKDSKYLTTTKLTNKSKICYELKRYTFDNEEIIEKYKIGDPNIIEKTCFKYENSELEELFDKIDYHKKFTKTQFEKLVRIIINIKTRNPVFSENFKNFNPYSDNVRKETKKVEDDAIELCKKLGINPELVQVTTKKVLDKFKNENYVKNIYRAGIYTNEESREELIKKLVKWDALVMTTNYENPFITSDNPGFNLDKKDQIYNTDFDSAHSMVFPISPKSLLVLNKAQRSDLNIYKNIYYKKMSLKSILKINKATSKNAYKLIISNSKEQLHITKKS